MNREIYKKQAIRKAVIAGSIIFLLFLLCTFLIIKPKMTNIKLLKAELINQNIKLQNYSDFGNTMTSFEDKKTKIKEYIGNFYGKLIPKDEIEKKFIEEISAILKEAEIKTNKITPIGNSYLSNRGYEKYLWNIRFVDDFRSLIKFMMILEQREVFFGIENISILSGKSEFGHTVEMSIYTVFPISIDSRDAMSKYDIHNSTVILGLPITTVKTFDLLGSKETELNRKLDFKVDPFSYEETIFPKVVEKPKEKAKAVKKAAPPPKLSLGGIIWDDEKPMVIINGQLFGKGDTVKGARIVKITKTSATFNWKGKYFKEELKK